MVAPVVERCSIRSIIGGQIRGSTEEWMCVGVRANGPPSALGHERMHGVMLVVVFPYLTGC